MTIYVVDENSMIGNVPRIDLCLERVKPVETGWVGNLFEQVWD
jgi:hypothetical protein